MPSPTQRPAYSRLSSTLPAIDRVEAKATRRESAVEYGLFGAAALFVGLALVALYTSYSPEHQRVPNAIAAGLKADRVNLLLIETDRQAQPIGAKEWATSLTLLSVRPSAHEAAIVTIPGDLWVKLGAYGAHRLNAANSIGNSSGYPGQGPGLTMDTVAAVTGQPVHAFINVDASDLKTIIDRLGGIDLDVKRPLYEIRTHQRFSRGTQHMNGATAVVYANTTDVVGPEADRFARERRQRQLFAAIAGKISAASTQKQGLAVLADLLTPSSEVRTNLHPEELTSVCATLSQIPAGGLSLRSMQELTSVVEISSISESGEVLQPKGGTFDQIQQLARDPFPGRTMISTNPPNPQSPQKAAPRATLASMR
jgi:LCP family protein required for cell wall assembly